MENEFNESLENEKDDSLLMPAKLKSSALKSEIERKVKAFPCIYDKQHAFFRNQAKRNQAWSKIACDMEITVTEAKTLWKKAKDSQRYLAKKERKFNCEEDCYEDTNDTEAWDDETIYVSEFSGASQNQMFSINKVNSVPSLPKLSYGNEKEDRSTSPTTSTYSSTVKKQGNRLQRGIQQIDPIKNQNNSDTLKYVHTWHHLENLYEQLDETTITDLNYEIVTLVYNAVVANRKKEPNKYALKRSRVEIETRNNLLKPSNKRAAISTTSQAGDLAKALHNIADSTQNLIGVEQSPAPWKNFFGTLNDFCGILTDKHVEAERHNRAVETILQEKVMGTEVHLPDIDAELEEEITPNPVIKCEME